MHLISHMVKLCIFYIAVCIENECLCCMEYYCAKNLFVMVSHNEPDSVIFLPSRNC